MTEEHNANLDNWVKVIQHRLDRGERKIDLWPMTRTTHKLHTTMLLKHGCRLCPNTGEFGLWIDGDLFRVETKMVNRVVWIVLVYVTMLNRKRLKEKLGVDELTRQHFIDWWKNELTLRGIKLRDYHGENL